MVLSIHCILKKVMSLCELIVVYFFINTQKNSEQNLCLGYIINFTNYFNLDIAFYNTLPKFSRAHWLMFIVAKRTYT